MKRFLTFNIVGIVNTLTAYIVYSILIYLHFDYTFALIMDYVVGMLLGLYLNKKFTFKIGKKITKKNVIRSIKSNIIIFSINIMILYILIDNYNHNAYISQIFALIIISIVSFFFYRLYIFKEELSVDQ